MIKMKRVYICKLCDKYNQKEYTIEEIQFLFSHINITHQIKKTKVKEFIMKINKQD